MYNGDFEIYSDCPQYASNPFSIPYEIQKCTGWTSPTYGTSDYFNSCNNSINSIVGVPVNVDGYQNPYSGNGYCGFLAYSLSNGGCYTGSYWWEYIQGSFINPLIAGHTYQIGFRFCFTEASDVAVKELGFYISENKVENICSPAPLPYIPQITGVSTNYFNDTANWFLISGKYTAIGGEKYITIGNFKDSITTDTMILYPNINANFSYYFIDSGSAYDITEIEDCNKNIFIPNIFTPNGDGINDEIQFYDSCFKILSLAIYNRWGKIITRSTTNISWNGNTSSGELCSDTQAAVMGKQTL